MIEEISWKMFEKTGNIDQYMLYKEIENTLKSSDENGLYNTIGSGAAPQGSGRA